MATLTVRQPTSPAARAVRGATWVRRGEDGVRPLPRRATPVWSDLYSLQPPAASTPICVGPEAASVAGASAAAAAATTVALCGDTLAEAASAGWFESTWELQQGLDVAEGLPNDVPLEAWLQVYLNA